MSTQSDYDCRRHERIDARLIAGVVTGTDHAEPLAARRRIAQLEAELAFVSGT